MDGQLSYERIFYAVLNGLVAQFHKLGEKICTYGEHEIGRELFQTADALARAIYNESAKYYSATDESENR